MALRNDGSRGNAYTFPLDDQPKVQDSHRITIHLPAIGPQKALVKDLEPRGPEPRIPWQMKVDLAQGTGRSGVPRDWLVLAGSGR